jgi:leucyl aminopeptidase
MDIKSSVNKEHTGHLVLLGRSPDDFHDHITEAHVIDYIKKRIEKEKIVTLLNDGSRAILLVTPKKGDKQQPPHLALENSREAAHASYSVIRENDLETLRIVNCGLTPDEALAFCEGLYLSDYRFNKYLTDNKKAFSLKETDFYSEDIGSEDLQEMVNVLEGVFFARDLVNEPLSYLTATKLAEEVTEKSKTSGFSVEVFNKKKIESLRMGGLLAVNRGSVDPPTFSILEWKPERPVNKKPFVLVGKGIVYDTGGLSLKPTHDSMDYMKSDMAGAAVVAGSIHAIALNKLPVWIIGLIPATDNRPDGNAYVPGDVVTMYDGSTVEVLNTDAEGRMILADALSYAKQYKPDLVIELSTLTGAAQAAIGKYGIVGMGNAPRSVFEALKNSGEQVFERIAEFPFWDDYSDLLSSAIADQKNIGGKVAGAITAGKFLEKFTDFPFIHLDIAGPSFVKNEYSYRGKGGTGVGVRLLYDFFSHVSK